MANLPENDLTEVWEGVMGEFSAFHELIPINKNQLRTLLVLMDDELEAAEVSIIQALPAGPGKTWLVDHPSIGRDLMARIERKRQEVL
jgi:hypothetical protein